jgi:hypothetical protein
VTIVEKKNRIGSSRQGLLCMAVSQQRSQIPRLAGRKKAATNHNAKPNPKNQITTRLSSAFAKAREYSKKLLDQFNSYPVFSEEIRHSHPGVGAARFVYKWLRDWLRSESSEPRDRRVDVAHVESDMSEPDVTGTRGQRLAIGGRIVLYQFNRVIRPPEIGDLDIGPANPSDSLDRSWITSSARREREVQTVLEQIYRPVEIGDCKACMVRRSDFGFGHPGVRHQLVVGAAAR